MRSAAMQHGGCQCFGHGVHRRQPNQAFSRLLLALSIDRGCCGTHWEKTGVSDAAGGTNIDKIWTKYARIGREWTGEGERSAHCEEKCDAYWVLLLRVGSIGWILCSQDLKLKSGRWKQKRT